MKATSTLLSTNVYSHYHSLPRKLQKSDWERNRNYTSYTKSHTQAHNQPGNEKHAWWVKCNRLKSSPRLPKIHLENWSIGVTNSNSDSHLKKDDSYACGFIQLLKIITAVLLLQLLRVMSRKKKQNTTQHLWTVLPLAELWVKQTADNIKRQ